MILTLKPKNFQLLAQLSNLCVHVWHTELSREGNDNEHWLNWTKNETARQHMYDGQVDARTQCDLGSQ